MNDLTRLKRRIVRKIGELVEQLVSFSGLILFTLLEAFYLFVLETVHQPVHRYIDHFPLCPMKIATVVVGLCFLALNVLTVGTFVAVHSRATVKVLTHYFHKRRR